MPIRLRSVRATSGIRCCLGAIQGCCRAGDCFLSCCTAPFKDGGPGILRQVMLPDGNGGDGFRGATATATASVPLASRADRDMSLFSGRRLIGTPWPEMVSCTPVAGVQETMAPGARWGDDGCSRQWHGQRLQLLSCVEIATRSSVALIRGSQSPGLNFSGAVVLFCFPSAASWDLVAFSP